MIVFANTITPRLKYIVDFIGKEIAGGPVDITDNKEIYSNHPGAKINYSDQSLSTTEIWVKPVSLLFESNISQQQIDCFETNGHIAFFKTEGDLSFDILAASFYLLSRYEEYLPHTKDIYGRYAHENSLACRQGFLDQPLVNTWLQYLKGALQKKFPNDTFNHWSFSFLPTYDIDEAYSYKHKAWWRSSGAAIKDLLKGRFGRFAIRWKVRNNEMPDPFDSYDWMDELHYSFQLKPRYFFLVPEKTGKYDRNILPGEPAVQAIIKRHAEKYKIGIHPSWQSGDEPSLIKKEKERIEQIASVKINSSRQHYIRFTLPETFRQLIAAGIQEDFSMGYGSINGFRASVASSFFWYDLKKEETTRLLLHPFCYMEANSYYEQKLNPAQALEEMRYYYKAVKKVDGMMVSIWHNTFLGTDKKFKGWRETYRQFLQEINT